MRDVCEDVLLAVTASSAIKSAPPEFKTAALVLHQAVAARFGASASSNSATGSSSSSGSSASDSSATAAYIGLINFFFLRYYCPALAIPQGNGLWTDAGGAKEEAVPRPVSRLLIHVSSLLQKAAAMQAYKEKDGHLAVAFNEWLATNAVARVAKFCKKMAVAAVGAAPAEAPSDEAEAAAAVRQQLEAVTTFVAADPIMRK